MSNLVTFTRYPDCSHYGDGGVGTTECASECVCVVNVPHRVFFFYISILETEDYVHETKEILIKKPSYISMLMMTRDPDYCLNKKFASF